MPSLPPLNTTRKTGNEAITDKGYEIGLNLLDFWQWSFSDIVNNTTRGVLAEFIVASALGIQKDKVRRDWTDYDLITEEGITIEVKSAAYIQSWHQKDYSKISFGIAPSRSWNPDGEDEKGEPKRSADLYVFCLLKEKNQEKLNPLLLEQWEFYVVTTSILNKTHPNSRSISLKKLKQITDAVGFSEIKSEVN